MFSKRHYEHVAETLAISFCDMPNLGHSKENEVMEKITQTFINMFSKDNPKFKPETFKKYLEKEFTRRVNDRF